jgi:hypothetical protein
MSQQSDPTNKAVPFKIRLVRMLISIGVLTFITVIFGYGGWIVLSLTAKSVGYDPQTEEGDLLRNRLVNWPERNKEVMRSNGRKPLH